MTIARIAVASFASLVLTLWGVAQKPEDPQAVPTAVQWTLDAAGPTQRTAIKSVVLLYCPNSNMKGTGFILREGLVVTNNHVVEGCSAQEMKADPFGQSEFGFDKMATDARVDLAVLRPTKHFSEGLELAPDTDPAIGTTVSTWGFPLTYNGPAPLLSVGYVAGYVKDGANGQEVKHIVVNGAFNPGNSGGPLFRSTDNKVIGVVVAKFRLYPPYVEEGINVLAHPNIGFGGYTFTDEHGRTQNLMESQVTAKILEQFYKTTQVMIGEAISVSEVRAFLNKHRADVLIH